jgi:hypothetical protein
MSGTLADVTGNQAPSVAAGAVGRAQMPSEMLLKAVRSPVAAVFSVVSVEF